MVPRITNDATRAALLCALPGPDEERLPLDGVEQDVLELFEDGMGEPSTKQVLDALDEFEAAGFLDVIERLGYRLSDQGLAALSEYSASKGAVSVASLYPNKLEATKAEQKERVRAAILCCIPKPGQKEELWSDIRGWAKESALLEPYGELPDATLNVAARDMAGELFVVTHITRGGGISLNLTREGVEARDAYLKRLAPKSEANTYLLVPARPFDLIEFLTEVSGLCARIDKNVSDRSVSRPMLDHFQAEERALVRRYNEVFGKAEGPEWDEDEKVCHLILQTLNTKMDATESVVARMERVRAATPAYHSTAKERELEKLEQAKLQLAANQARSQSCRWECDPSDNIAWVQRFTLNKRGEESAGGKYYFDPQTGECPCKAREHHPDTLCVHMVFRADERKRRTVQAHHTALVSNRMQALERVLR